MISTALPTLSRKAVSQNDPEVETSTETSKVLLMQTTLDKLQSERDALSNTVSDLQQLIKRLSIEHSKEAESHLKSIKDCETKVKRLIKATEAAEQNAGHFDDMRDYWEEFL